METVNQYAKQSTLKFKVPKGQLLHEVWNSLWEQCEEANETLQTQKTCYPRPNRSIYNTMKMLSEFQNELVRRGLDSGSTGSQRLAEDLCVSCGLSKTKQKLLEDNYKRRGEIIEYLLSQSEAPPKLAFQRKPTYSSYTYNDNLDDKEMTGSKGNMYGQKSGIFSQKERYSLENQILNQEKTTETLTKLLLNFSKYDPSKDPLTNMSVFENECFQHSLGSRESCLMMKLWLPSHMSVRLAAPVSRPACGPQLCSDEDHWGDTLDRLKALTLLATGEDDLGIQMLEDLKVTPQDDPWIFAQKFEQAYRLVMGVKDPKPLPTMLKALVNKFTYLDCSTHIAASKEDSISGIVKIVDRFRRDQGMKESLIKRRQFNPILINDPCERPSRLERQLSENLNLGCSQGINDQPTEFLINTKPMVKPEVPLTHCTHTCKLSTAREMPGIRTSLPNPGKAGKSPTFGHSWA